MYCIMLLLSMVAVLRTALYPTTCVFSRWAIFFSMPSKAPPQMNRIFLVLTGIIFWSGCLRPPWGGTFTTEPSSSFSNPCCTPSPLTSRVMEGLSPLRATLLCLGHVIIRHLEQTCQNAFNVLTHITCLCQNCCIYNSKRNMQQLCDSTRQ